MVGSVPVTRLHFHRADELQRITGVDLTRIDGVDVFRRPNDDQRGRTGHEPMEN